jgi:xylulokinase
VKGGKYLAALDIGTYSCKAAIYDPEHHRMYSASKEYSLLFPDVGYVEQDPGVWYRAMVCALTDTLKKVPDAVNNIAALCISGTNALVMVDEQGLPVCNAVMFSDRRSEVQASELTRRYGTRIDEITGNHPVAGSFSLPIINWFRQVRPELWKKVHTLLVPAGYIIMKLTGKKTIDKSRASMTLLFDLAERQWSKEICAREDISSEILPDLFEPWEVVGDITPEVSNLIGIKTGVPVLAGCVDSVAACVGAGIIESGQVVLMLGTTGRVSMSIDSPDFDSKLINQCHAIPAHWICIGAMNNSGGSLKWFTDSFGHLEKAMNARAGVSTYTLIDTAASRSSPGSRGIVYLPYLSGERSPVWNSRARGVFFGLFDGSNWSDLARSVMEGVAFSFRDNLISIEQTAGKRATRFMLVGGGAKSRLWRQILCDVLERPLDVPEVIEVETLGCIALAGYASQVWRSIEEALAELSTKTEKVSPNPRHSEVYRRGFRLYKDLYHALLPIFDKAAEAHEKSLGTAAVTHGELKHHFPLSQPFQ